MNNYLTILVIVVISLLTVDTNAEPWNNNTREHLFNYKHFYSYLPELSL